MPRLGWGLNADAPQEKSGLGFRVLGFLASYVKPNVLLLQNMVLRSGDAEKESATQGS